MAEAQDYRRRKDDYEAGQRAAQIAHLDEAIARTERALADHRAEERETWQTFLRALDAIRADLQEIRNEQVEIKVWRAKMMGIAAAIATVASIAWQIVIVGIKGGRQ